MATNLATIVVELQSKTASFQNQFSQATDTVKKKTTQLTQATNKTVAGSKNLQESFRKASQSIAAIQGPLGPVAGRITSLGTIIGNVGLKTAALTLGFAGLVFALGAAIKVGSRAERQFLKLEGILKATGFSAGLTIQEIEGLAQSIGKETLASTQGVRDAAGVLLTFKSITGETFKDALRLSQDLAEVGFGSVESAALQLGKALEDPKVGLASLRRVGVSFTEQQKEQIKVLDFLGKKQEQQAIITKVVNEQVGKTGVRAAEGLAGALDTLNEEFTLLIENNTLTKLAISAVTGLLKGLNALFGEFAGTLRGLNLKDLEKELANVNQEIDKQSKLLENLQGDIDSSFISNQTLIDLETKRQTILNAINKVLEDRAKLEKAQKDKKEETIPVEKELNDIAEKRHLNITREIEDIGKTEKELKVLNEARKIEDALRKEGIKDAKTLSDFVDTQITQIRNQVEEVERLSEAQRKLDDIGNGLASTFRTAGDAIVDAFLRGEKGSINFKNILREVLIGIQKTIINVLILEQIEKQIRASVSGKGGLLGTIFKGITGAFGGGDLTATQGSSATGGSVQSNRSVLVGERGPELFVPRTAGSITPSSLTPGKMGGGGGVTIQQNLNFATGIQNTVRAEVLNLLPQIQQSTIAAVADAKLRGGKFSKAFGA
jgi:hypothetical protein